MNWEIKLLNKEAFTCEHNVSLKIIGSAYDAFSDLCVISEPFGPKIESMVNQSSSLISPIYRLGSSLKANSMQIKTYKADFVFSPI